MNVTSSLPEKAVFIIELNCSHSSGQVSHNSLQQPIMDGQANEHLELVILAQPAAGRLNLGDQLGVHPPELRGPRDRAARPFR